MSYRTFRPWQYLVVPVLFLMGVLLFLGAGVGPVAAPYIGIARYFFSNTPTPQPTDLFTGIAQSIEQSATVPLSQFTYPQKGDLYAQITIDDTSVNAPIYYGDGTKELNQGVGTYVDSSGAGLPGEGETILLGGHNNTFFNGLQDVEEGDIVKISTHYGNYEYRVNTMRVAQANDETTYDFSKKEENLILYTCYPFDMFGLTPQRYFVYAEYVSGPEIDPTS